MEIALLYFTGKETIH